MSADDIGGEHDAFLGDLSENVKQDFLIKKRVLSFEEYFSLALSQPLVHARNAAQYLVDCFRHFGADGDRFQLFDVPFEDGLDHLVGQEQSLAGRVPEPGQVRPARQGEPPDPASRAQR